METLKREQETEENREKKVAQLQKWFLKYQPPKKYYNQSEKKKQKELSNGNHVWVLAVAGSRIKRSMCVMPGIVTCEKQGKGHQFKSIPVSYVFSSAVPACGQSKCRHWGTCSWLSYLLWQEQVIIPRPWDAGIIDRKYPVLHSEVRTFYFSLKIKMYALNDKSILLT